MTQKEIKVLSSILMSMLDEELTSAKGILSNVTLSDDMETLKLISSMIDAEINLRDQGFYDWD